MTSAKMTALHTTRCKLIDEADRWLSRMLRAATRLKKIRQQMARNVAAIQKQELAEQQEGPF
jgi:hypothetical protein